jgi:PHD/YefM family antitoxin component YafN of YafNO toxin-antitoxin module
MPNQCSFPVRSPGQLGRSGSEMNSAREEYVVDTKGRKRAVILSLRRYEQLIEDLHDLAVVPERRNEKAIIAEEFRRRLKRDGNL